MNKEIISIALALGCVSSIATTNNYDLLGRKGSKMNTPMVYKNVDYSKVKKNEQQKLNSSLENRSLAKSGVGLKGNTKAIVGKFGPNGYGFKNCGNSSSGCGESVKPGLGLMGLSQYLSTANQNFIEVVSQEKSRLSSDFNYVTAGPTRCNLSGYTMTENPYRTSGPIAQSSPYGYYITYVPSTTVNSRLGRFYRSRTNVGVYISGLAAPVRLNKDNDLLTENNLSAPFIVADNGSINSFVKKPDDEVLASRMYKLVQKYSDQSSVFATRSRPSNPAGENPQVYVGLHGDNAAGSYSYYPPKAKDLDNYIYNKRTVEIVAAGNHASGNFSHKAHAVNAITVGALDPITNNPTNYSAHNLPKYCNGCSYVTYNKPEIYNYSNFYIDDYRRKYEGIKNYEFLPYYDGTETAAAVTAGVVSNMLSYNEFYKWHPEVVKAVALNTDDLSAKYDDFVFNQNDEKHLHHSFYFIGDVNTLMKEYRDCPNQSEIFCSDKRKEIRLHFSKSDLVRPLNVPNDRIDGFEASISWLNSGNDIANLGGLPQNFEIEGFWRHGNPNLFNNLYNNAGLDDSSVRNYDQQGSAYKKIVMSGRAKDMNPLGFTIRIVLTDEDSRSENYGQMVLGLDVKPIIK